MRYAQATADALHAPASYVQAVMSAQPVQRPAAPVAAQDTLKVTP